MGPFPLYSRNAVVFDSAVINMRVKTVKAFQGHRNSLTTSIDLSPDNKETFGIRQS